MFSRVFNYSVNRGYFGYLDDGADVLVREVPRRAVDALHEELRRLALLLDDLLHARVRVALQARNHGIPEIGPESAHLLGRDLFARASRNLGIHLLQLALHEVGDALQVLLHAQERYTSGHARSPTGALRGGEAEDAANAGFEELVVADLTGLHETHGLGRELARHGHGQQRVLETVATR